MQNGRCVDRFGKESEWDRVGMTEEPGDQYLRGYDAGDPQDDRERNDISAAAKQPCAAGQDDKNTEPRHLANGSESDVREPGRGQPECGVDVLLSREGALAK